MTEARILTIRQPWAEAVADGYKTIENRSGGFPSSYTGPLWIHAGAAFSSRGICDPRIVALYGARLGDILRAQAFTTAAIIGRVELVDVHRAAGCCTPWGEDHYTEAGGNERTDLTHLVLEDAIRLEHPIPAIGKLGLWRPDPDLDLELTRAR